MNRVGVVPIGRGYLVKAGISGGGSTTWSFEDPRSANYKVSKLLALPMSLVEWNYPYQGLGTQGGAYIRVTRGFDGMLLGQWVVSNGAWCHQGGPWKSGVPNCTGVYPPKPTYPSVPYLGSPPLPPRYRGGWW